MGKRDGRSPAPQACFLQVEPLEDRCLLSALGGAPERAPAKGPAAIVRNASPSSRSGARKPVRSERQAGTAQQASTVEVSGNTDAPGEAGQQDQQGGTGDNQSVPQEVVPSAGDPSPLPPPGVMNDSEDPVSGPAAPSSSEDEAPNVATPSPGAGAVVPPPADGTPAPRLAVVGPASGAAALLVSAAAETHLAEGDWLARQVPPGADGSGTAVLGADVGGPPAAVGANSAGREASGGPGDGGVVPGSSSHDRLVPWLAGELRGTLVVDTAVLERGLQRFLDQLNAFGLPGQGRDPGGPSWLGRVPALLPWLGAALAATTAVELTRRRLRPPPESAFPSPGDGGRWHGTAGLADPLQEEEP